MTEHRPWLEAYPPGRAPTLEPYPHISVFTMLERSARTFPDAVAMAWFGRHLPYRPLLRAVGPIPPAANVDPRAEMAALVHTGGTTGVRKPRRCRT
jgi:hypothetical protein